MDAERQAHVNAIEVLSLNFEVGVASLRDAWDRGESGHLERQGLMSTVSAIIARIEATVPDRVGALVDEHSEGHLDTWQQLGLLTDVDTGGLL